MEKICVAVVVVVVVVYNFEQDHPLASHVVGSKYSN